MVLKPFQLVHYHLWALLMLACTLRDRRRVHTLGPVLSTSLMTACKVWSTRTFIYIVSIPSHACIQFSYIHKNFC
jgi:hypothetical protein